MSGVLFLSVSPLACWFRFPFCFLSGVLVPLRCLIPCFSGVAWCPPVGLLACSPRCCTSACPSYTLPGAFPRALLLGGSYSSGLVPCRCLAPAWHAWLVEVCLCMALSCKAFLLKKKKKKKKKKKAIFFLKSEVLGFLWLAMHPVLSQ